MTAARRRWCCAATSADAWAQTRYDAHNSAKRRERLGFENGMTGSRKLYVKSFGCQMNVYDSQRMADTLAPEGYVETAAAEDADLVILNTCHIREKAAEKVYSELGRVRRLKEAAAADGRRRSHRGRRLRGAGRGRGDHPPGAGGRSGGRLAELPSPARPDRARAGAAARPSIPSFRSTTSSTISPHRARPDPRARRHRLRHGAGGLRQVLHLLRRALYARRGNLAAGQQDPRPRSSGWPRPACAKSR